MSRRRAIRVAVAALAVVLLHVLLVRAMAHGHVAHVLLGSGNATPPIGAALLAVALVIARFVAIVIAPGALLAAVVSMAAHALVGPKDGAQGDGDGAGKGTRSGTGIKSDEGAAGTGINIEGRAM